MRALKGPWGPTLSAALAAATFFALASPSRTQEVEEADGVEAVEERPVVGTLRGVIREIDFEHSRVRIATDTADLWLRARPFDLVTLSPGDDATLRYTTFNDEMWLTPVFLEPMPRPAPGTPSAFPGSWASLTGVVREVYRDGPSILVEDRLIRIHPRQVAELVPGQLVSVTVLGVGETLWAGTIDPVGPAGSPGVAGIGAENAVPGRPTEGRGSAAPVGAESFPRNSYPVPGFGSDVELGRTRGPLGTQIIPPRPVDDPSTLEED